MKKKITLSEILIGLLFIGGFIAIQSLFYNVPTVVLSCKDGEFKRFGVTSMPPACIGCIPDCYGKINVKTTKNKFVCNNSIKSYGLGNTNVPCKELSSFEGETLIINYSTKGYDKTFQNEIEVVYNG